MNTLNIYFNNNYKIFLNRSQIELENLCYQNILESRYYHKNSNIRKFFHCDYVYDQNFGACLKSKVNFNKIFSLSKNYTFTNEWLPGALCGSCKPNIYLAKKDSNPLLL